jgi:hypothetical protein
MPGVSAGNVVSSVWGCHIMSRLALLFSGVVYVRGVWGATIATDLLSDDVCFEYINSGIRTTSN